MEGQGEVRDVGGQVRGGQVDQVNQQDGLLLGLAVIDDDGDDQGQGPAFLICLRNSSQISRR